MISDVKSIVGSPRRQLPVVEALAAGESAMRRRVEERPDEQPEEMVSQPPYMRKAVASSRWPSALLRQESDV